MKLDSHQHFWKFNPVEYSWIPDGSPIRRDFLPADLEPILAHQDLDGSIAVQARQSLKETRWLLELADQWPIVKAVVGWVDLRSEKVEAQLEEFSAHRRFAGARHVVQDEPDVNFMLSAEFQKGIAALKRYRLTYDILIYPKQLSAAVALVRKFPEQPFVLDHGAKPLIARQVISPWREQIKELAANPNIFCKISGLVTEADRKAWKAADLNPYFDVLFEAFGEDRLMFGSDWPVCLLAGSYSQVFDLVHDYAKSFTQDARDKIFGKNAARFYRIGTSR